MIARAPCRADEAKAGGVNLCSHMRDYFGGVIWI